METLRALVLSANIFAQFRDTKVRGFSIEQLEEHSMAVGAWAKLLARTESCPSEVGDEALMAGLLHDVGRLLLAANVGEAFEQALALADEQAIPVVEAEREVLGASHAEMGAYLLGLWGLPDSILEAVAFHHRPGDCIGGGCTALTVVHVADALENQARLLPLEVPATALDLDYLRQLGLDARLPVWYQKCGVAEPERELA
jgi:putative nucleotidyltransferase with HDIG domain